MAAALKKIDFSPLRDQSLRRLVIAQLTSVSGDFIVVAALPFAVFSIGGSTTEVSIAFGAGALFEVMLVLYGGVIGDRFTTRTVMIGADLLRFASQGLLAVVLIAGVAEFWQLVVAQILQGAGAAFFNPSMDALMPEVVSEERLQESNAVLTIGPALGTMLGPALAGVLGASAGVGWAFALDAATFATSAALLASLRVAYPSLPQPSSSFVGELREGWGEFRKRTWLWVIVAEFTVLNALVFGPWQVLGATTANHSLGGAGSWALILAVAGLGQIGGAVIAIAWRPRRPLHSATLLVGLGALPLILLALGAPVVAIAIGAGIGGSTMAIFAAIWHTMLQSNVPEGQRARMSSYDWMGSLAMLPIGYLIAAAAVPLIGAQAMLLVSAAVLLTATAIIAPQPAIKGVRYRQARRPLKLATAGAGTEAP